MMFGRWLVKHCVRALLLLGLSFAAPAAKAEDGYDLWLRYRPLENARLPGLRPAISTIEVRADLSSPRVAAARDELIRGLSGLTGATPRQGDQGLLLALQDRVTLKANARIAADAPAGSYLLTRIEGGRPAIVAREESGLIYGAFALLRHLQQHEALPEADVLSMPRLPLRLLNHWDNPDGLVERGYAGRSIFDWWRLPEHLDRRMVDYARANASIGINGTVVNNVNASPLFLTDRYLPKLARLADALRPYGIRLYISARFSAPRDVGGLKTADPLDPAVQAWWDARVKAIYAAIPDFGGFLVKANSEKQPGPQDYGRTHADGANMLARALGDRGTVMWRAFVYSELDETDRARQAFAEFVPLDGQFADNVIIQIKNGPIDFQPREPFHPIFGAMPKTRLMLEAQITKEYLGFSTHLAFLAPMWREVFDASTGPAGSVTDTILTGGIAGVANTGSDRNWTGSHFDQANWYAFGRLAWEPGLASEAIAREWAAQTFNREKPFLDGVVPIMLASHQAVVDYMTPLGLAHQMGTGHHYGPGPWVCNLARPEWNPCYYSRAGRDGIGFDRTARGSDALSQYHPSAAAQWADLARIDENYLLWFHHVPWNHPMASGRTLWDEMVHNYDRGRARVDWMAGEWVRLAPYVDPARHGDVASFLGIQQREAKWWRDASIAWWQSVNRLPLADGVAPPPHPVAHYRSLTFPEAPAD